MHDAGRGSSQSGVIFKRIAHLSTAVFPAVDSRVASKEQRLQLKQQEDMQRNHLQQTLQLQLDNSSPDLVQAIGDVESC